MTKSLAIGIVFEMPILCWLFAKQGFLSADFMRRYRKLEARNTVHHLIEGITTYINDEVHDESLWRIKHKE